MMGLIKKIFTGDKKQRPKPTAETGPQESRKKKSKKGHQKAKRTSIGKTITISIHNAKNIHSANSEEGNSNVIFRFGNAQHIGKRSSQQDSFGYSNLVSEEIIKQYGILAVLADGMGGLSDGKQVSDYAVNAMLTMFTETDGSTFCPENLLVMAESLNDRVNEAFPAEGNVQAGSTLIAAHIYGDSLNWISIGDSRIYLYRNSMLYQLNEEHNYLSDLLKSHITTGLPLKEAKTDPQKSALTSYIGSPSIKRVDQSIRPLRIIPGDRIVLCSDGIYNALNNFELISNIEYEPQEAAERIVDLALDKKNPDQDNLTIMIIEYNYN